MFKVSALALATAFAASLETIQAQVPVTLVRNSWVASALDVAIARQIIEENFRDVDVQVVDIGSNTETLDSLADGSLGAAAVLEVWPSTVADQYPDLEADGSVVYLGELGVVGQIGWYVPSYVVDQYPEADSYDFYQKFGTASLFATPETDPLGRFVGVTAGYSDLDGQIITNLQMPFAEVFSGGEDESVALLDDAVSNRENILMYWWSPTAEVPFYNLTRVELPPLTQSCVDSIQNGDGSYECDYPPDPTFKVASADLKDVAPSIYDFLQSFTITDEDQLEMLPRVNFGGEAVEAVAADWVSNNQAVWSQWVPGAETARPTGSPTSSAMMPPPPSPNGTLHVVPPNETMNGTLAPTPSPTPNANDAPPPTLPPSGGSKAILGSFVVAPLFVLVWSSLL